MATGTAQIGRLPWLKPWSSSGLSSAGMAGSLSALMMVAPIAMAQPAR